MNGSFDMCIDLQTVVQISEKLKQIGSQLSDATKKMVDALQDSQGFLAGKQYEKARSLTLKTVETSTVTATNINNALRYLSDLEEHVNNYSTCKYMGGH